MKVPIIENYTLVDNDRAYQQFLDENKEIKWLAFDTEFVGEKRYHTLICLLQAGTANGFYLIDPFAIKDLSRFYGWLADPSILKVSHAGENDYRILYRAYGVLPRNVFDTQVAAAFVGYNYPCAFNRLLDSELNVSVGKGYTVSNWESRPINKKQIQYALNDVLYLINLYEKLYEKLVDLNRVEWAREEFAKMEQPEHYIFDQHREALTSNMIKKMNTQEQVFLIRLYEWRRQLAEKRNHSREMVLPSKYIGPIIKNIRSGKAALQNHRRIPKYVIDQFWETFNTLHQKKVTPEERALLKQIPVTLPVNTGLATSMELMSLLMKMKAEKEHLAIGMLTLGIDIKRMKVEPHFFDEKLATGWRRKFLGEPMIHWLKNRERLDVDFSREECVLTIK